MDVKASITSLMDTPKKVMRFIHKLGTHPPKKCGIFSPIISTTYNFGKLHLKEFKKTKENYSLPIRPQAYILSVLKMTDYPKLMKCYNEINVAEG